MEAQPLFIRRLQEKLADEVRPAAVELKETHISWVLLAGEWAYKIKKPVDMGFLNFSTLELRRQFCEEELRINRRTAGELYVDVLPITGTPDDPQLDGNGLAFDYAVRMRRFPADALLADRLARGQVSNDDCTRLALEVARFHESAARSPAEAYWGSPHRIWKPVSETLQGLQDLLRGSEWIGPLSELQEWCRAEFRRLGPWFLARKEQGQVRECHGDLHLGNVVLLQDRIVPFDAIEFSPALRWIDVINDVAFMVMDLHDHRRRDLSGRFLNAYLEVTGDYSGLPGLTYYQVYRALVRAIVAALRGSQTQPHAPDRTSPLLCLGPESEVPSYLKLAQELTCQEPLRLVITCGVSGSGKTFGTQDLVETGFVSLRSDVERKRMFGRPALSRTPAEQLAFVYGKEATARVYQRLLDLATIVLDAGHSVIVDATFLRRSQRTPFQELARRKNIPFEIRLFEQPVDELRRRIAARLQSGHDASEADAEILDQQLANWERPGTDELGECT